MPMKRNKKMEEDINLHIIDLIHQRSVAFDEAREWRLKAEKLQELLNIAVSAIEDATDEELHIHDPCHIIITIDELLKTALLEIQLLEEIK